MLIILFCMDSHGSHIHTTLCIPILWGLYHAPVIPAGIQSFWWNLVESSGVIFDREPCQNYHSRGYLFWWNRAIPELGPEWTRTESGRILFSLVKYISINNNFKKPGLIIICFFIFIFIFCHAWSCDMLNIMTSSSSTTTTTTTTTTNTITATTTTKTNDHSNSDDNPNPNEQSDQHNNEWGAWDATCLESQVCFIIFSFIFHSTNVYSRSYLPSWHHWNPKMVQPTRLTTTWTATTAPPPLAMMDATGTAGGDEGLRLVCLKPLEVCFFF